MATPSSGEGRLVYLLRSRRPHLSVEILHSIEANPTIAIMRRIGAVDQPHTLVVTMSELQAAALALCFPGELIIELDRPLSPFD